MNQAKIRLSAKEAELVLNTDWILTKNEILKKSKQLLEALMEEQQKFIGSCKYLPAEILVIPAKISKGENYKGLPYLVLDHPRYFDKENIFAIRTLFWWGNFFSVTLHLAGKHKKNYEERILSAFPLLKEQAIYCCVNNEQWEHHFEKGNYRLIEEMTTADIKKIFSEKPFIKLAKKISLEEWNNAPQKLLNDFGLFIKLAGE
ncbi:MAG: hypothetical protein HOP10_00105 [Chitinophagaceae bacterium]|nr:hypothetical protein [Chitinophagaceae bacterium]